MQDLEELPEENVQQVEASPSTDKTDGTIRNLKQLCLICGEFRDERDTLFNSDESLANEIETVYRFVCLFSSTVPKVLKYFLIFHWSSWSCCY